MVAWYVLLLDLEPEDPPSWLEVSAGMRPNLFPLIRYLRVLPGSIGGLTSKLILLPEMTRRGSFPTIVVVERLLGILKMLYRSF